MNHIRQKVKLAEPDIKTNLFIEPTLQSKSNQNSRYISFAVIALLMAWVALTIVNNGPFVIEAIVTTCIISGVLFMRAFYHPKNIKKNYSK